MGDKHVHRKKGNILQPHYFEVKLGVGRTPLPPRRVMGEGTGQKIITTVNSGRKKRDGKTRECRAGLPEISAELRELRNAGQRLIL